MKYQCVENDFMFRRFQDASDGEELNKPDKPEKGETVNYRMNQVKMSRRKTVVL